MDGHHTDPASASPSVERQDQPESQSPKVFLRAAKESDLPIMGRIGGDACWDHPDNVRWAPYRRRHPRHYYRSYKYDCLDYFYRTGMRSMVAVVKTSPGSTETKNHAAETSGTKVAENKSNTIEEEVVGFAFWERKGSSELARKWRARSRTYDLKARRVAIEAYVADKLDMSKKRWLFDNGLDEDDEFLTDYRLKDAADQWMLELLVISPSCQNQGVGKLLMRDGIDLAQRENVPITLYSDVKVYEFYIKLGFDILYASVEHGTTNGYRMVRKPLVDKDQEEVSGS